MKLDCYHLMKGGNVLASHELRFCSTLNLVILMEFLSRQRIYGIVNGRSTLAVKSLHQLGAVAYSA